MARHRHHRRRRRRNPAGIGNVMQTAKRTIAIAIPAVAGGAIMSLIDAKLLAGRSQWIQVAGKVVAAALVGVALRKRPSTAQILMGSMLGTLGYQLGARLSGGVVAPNAAEAAKSMGYLVRENPAMFGALVDSSGQYLPGPSLSGLEIPPMNMVDVNLG
jgi:hypothetical protein